MALLVNAGKKQLFSHSAIRKTGFYAGQHRNRATTNRYVTIDQKAAGGKTLDKMLEVFCNWFYRLYRHSPYKS